MKQLKLEINDKEWFWINKIQNWEYDVCLDANEVSINRIHVNQYFSKSQGVYVFQNEINKKKYIGSTVSFQKRITSHIGKINHNKHDNLKFQNAVKSHGWSNFKIYLFIIPELTRNELFDIETVSIEFYKSTQNGYNKVVDSRSVDFSNEDKKKIGERLSKANKGKPKSEEHKRKCGIAISKTNSGEGNPLAKFTKEQILEIRTNYKNYSLQELADKYSCNKKLIASVLKLRSYNYPDYIPNEYIVPEKLGTNALLSKEDVLDIRSNIKNYTMQELCEKYKCDRHIISSIVHLKTYTNFDYIPEGYEIPKQVKSKTKRLDRDDIIWIRKNYALYTLPELCEKYQIGKDGILQVLMLYRWTETDSIPENYTKPTSKWKKQK